jgi:DNA-binding HxlR family transcriptional regulator
MTRTSLGDVTCSIARTVDILGDAWAWLIVRDTYAGVCRFEDLREDLGISGKVLSQRLGTLVDAGILARHPYAERPTRYEYTLTAKGNDLVPLLATLVAWGDRWEPTKGGPPMYFEHEDCGVVHATVTCSRCCKPVTAETLTVKPGPGGSTGPGTAVIGARLR